MNALIFSALSGVIMMFAGLLVRKPSAVRTLAYILLAAVMVLTLAELRGYTLFRVDTRNMMLFDSFALLFQFVAGLCTFVFFLLSGRDMEKVGRYHSDYYALIFFILVGVALTASFKSLLILFLGIEIISIPLYILTGSEKRNLASTEAALKYFLMGSFSTGLMLMGIALVYGATGTFVTAQMNFPPDSIPVLLIAGLLLLLFAMAFKVSAAPFHFWTPDVYDGSPTVFTSFMATVVKAAGFVGFLRLFHEAFGDIQPEWKLVVAIITAATTNSGMLLSRIIEK